jgi:hypothetical protein
MNNTETAELLRNRRDLTGAVYNDDTVATWQRALGDWSFEQCRDALTVAARNERRISVSHVVDQLPPNSRKTHSDRHARTCICDGRGWLEVEQHDDRGGSWLAWDRCPNGPRTGFHEPD